MADEAFALSPISARATLPSEADYDAIREAFMETARGRWFLTEYGKRNRNADTTMVLDAVARIEQTIAAQKQPAPVNALSESLPAIRMLVLEAKDSAARRIADIDASETLVAARDGARIVREIAWTLRECGADTRICDLLDTQVAAIDNGHREITAIGSRDAVLAPFDLLIQRIAELSGDATSQDYEVSPPTTDDAAPAVAVEAAIERPPAAPTTQRPAQDSAAQAVEPQAAAEPQPVALASEPVVADAPDVAARDLDVAALDAPVVDTPEQDAKASEAEEMQEPAARAEQPPASEPSASEPDQDFAASEYAVEEIIEGERGGIEDLEAEAAQDSAVLDIVAAEMAEPDQAAIDMPVPRSPEPAVAAVSEPGPAFRHAAPAEAPPAEVSAAPEARLVPDLPASPAESKPADSNSLGAALLASGVVRKPSLPAADPLAPFRRMSQAERIAFFS